MPAKSKKQQEYFGMVESGKIPPPKGMNMEQVKEFASTKHAGLPERKGPKEESRAGRHPKNKPHKVRNA